MACQAGSKQTAAALPFVAKDPQPAALPPAQGSHMLLDAGRQVSALVAQAVSQPNSCGARATDVQLTTLHAASNIIQSHLFLSR